MPGASRKGIDSAGALISGGSSDVLIEGYGAVRKLDSVTPHDSGDHDNNPFMVGCSSTVFINGRGAVRAGDLASCGHSASGSQTVIIGG
jgi:uncharacterized Zn-binding protein involved in type VI secretion